MKIVVLLSSVDLSSDTSSLIKRFCCRESVEKLRKVFTRAEAVRFTLDEKEGRVTTA